MPNSPRARDGRGNFTRSVSQRRKDDEAGMLYEQLRSYRAVARQLNIPVMTAYDRVHRAIWGEPENDVATARKISLARLDAMADIAEQAARENHLAYSNGRLVMMKGEDGEMHPIRDRLPNLQAVDRLLRVEEQKNRLLGTNAPTQTRVEVVPVDVIERLIMENERLIAAAEMELGLSTTHQAAIDVTSVVKEGTR